MEKWQSEPRAPDAGDGFLRAFGERAVFGARAPGRVNWIGEHTDYEEGLVLPSAIDRDTTVWVGPLQEPRWIVESQGFGRAEIDLADLRPGRGWIDYLEGVAFAFQESGHPPGGARFWIESEVPANAGLSSSAALGVAVAFGVDRLFGFGLSALELARIAHRGENGFVGIGCGVLDHFASALGEEQSALRIDCRDHTVRPVPLAKGELTLLVAESGVERRLATAGYADRVRECREAFTLAKEGGLLEASATHLRDVQVDHLPALAKALPTNLYRRARHVVTENARVDEVVSAFGEGDLDRVGTALAAGQASLRDDFEVSVPELDHLCTVADQQAGCWGSRLTGAGFGGCTLHLVRTEASQRVIEGLQAGFVDRFGTVPEVHAVRLGPGAEAFDIR